MCMHKGQITEKQYATSFESHDTPISCGKIFSSYRKRKWFLVHFLGMKKISTVAPSTKLHSKDHVNNTYLEFFVPVVLEMAQLTLWWLSWFFTHYFKPFLEYIKKLFTSQIFQIGNIQLNLFCKDIFTQTQAVSTNTLIMRFPVIQ